MVYKLLVFLLMFYKPLYDVDLINFEAHHFHEDDLVHLCAVLVMEPKNLLAESDRLLEHLDDRPAKDEREHVLCGPVQLFFMLLPNFVKVILELMPPVLYEAYASTLPKLNVFLHNAI